MRAQLRGFTLRQRACSCLASPSRVGGERLAQAQCGGRARPQHGLRAPPAPARGRSAGGGGRSGGGRAAPQEPAPGTGLGPPGGRHAEKKAGADPVEPCARWLRRQRDQRRRVSQARGGGSLRGRYGGGAPEGRLTGSAAPGGWRVSRGG